MRKRAVASTLQSFRIYEGIGLFDSFKSANYTVKILAIHSLLAEDWITNIIKKNRTCF